MYVASEKDSAIYNSPDEKAYFETVYAKLKERKLNIHHLELSTNQDETSYYIDNFTMIANRTVYNDGKETLAKNLNENERFIAVDNITKKMVLPLAIENSFPYAKLYIKNTINAFGNLATALLYLIILIFALVTLRKYDSHELKIIVLGIMLTLANGAFIALGMHTVKRFTFYNDWVLFLVVFILLDTFIVAKKNPA
jgi:O-antigen ligase